MKKLICVLMVFIIMACLFCGCNKQVFDFTYSYNYGIIKLPNGDVVEGDISSWTDFEDGDQLQIVIDGTTYLVHSSNAVLINK